MTTTATTAHGLRTTQELAEQLGNLGAAEVVFQFTSAMLSEQTDSPRAGNAYNAALLKLIEATDGDPLFARVHDVAGCAYFRFNNGRADRIAGAAYVFQTAAERYRYCASGLLQGAAQELENDDPSYWTEELLRHTFKG